MGNGNHLTWENNILTMRFKQEQEFNYHEIEWIHQTCGREQTDKSPQKETTTTLSCDSMLNQQLGDWSTITSLEADLIEVVGWNCNRFDWCEKTKIIMFCVKKYKEIVL